MELAFRILAVILAGIAAYFLWNGNKDGAFLTAVFGAVSFFLSVRFQVKARLNEREAEKLEEEKRRRGEEEAEETTSGGGRQLTEDAFFDEQAANGAEQRTKDEVL